MFTTNDLLTMYAACAALKALPTAQRVTLRRDPPTDAEITDLARRLDALMSERKT